MQYQCPVRVILRRRLHNRFRRSAFRRRVNEGEASGDAGHSRIHHSSVTHTCGSWPLPRWLRGPLIDCRVDRHIHLRCPSLTTLRLYTSCPPPSVHLSFEFVVLRYCAVEKPRHSSPADARWVGLVAVGGGRLRRGDVSEDGDSAGRACSAGAARKVRAAAHHSTDILSHQTSRGTAVAV